MSVLNTYLDSKKSDEMFLLFWNQIKSVTYKEIDSLMATGKTKEEAETIVVEQLKQAINNAEDEELFNMINERKNDNFDITLDEVVTEFNLDMDEIMELVHKLEGEE